ncbi:hypothetical protein AAG570_009374 [Ranatra chinensis]|uniref:Uncharacterized protein n=1 Tax=Ranatra chinensis TaxID=642074 RepID=A0ABD0Z9Z7_9HEMI
MSSQQTSLSTPWLKPFALTTANARFVRFLTLVRKSADKIHRQLAETYGYEHYEIEAEASLDYILTGDESWICHYTPESIRHYRYCMWVVAYYGEAKEEMEKWLFELEGSVTDESIKS